VDITAFGTAAVGALAGVCTAYLALRRDGRESHAQAITEAKETIELLKEQTSLMRQQGETRERGSGAGSSRRGTSARRALRSASRRSRATTAGLCSL
jgi:hypothetical protein